jgi:hypothetical protein
MKSIVHRGFSPNNGLCKCTGNTSTTFLFISAPAAGVLNLDYKFLPFRKKTC